MNLYNTQKISITWKNKAVSLFYSGSADIIDLKFQSELGPGFFKTVTICYRANNYHRLIDGKQPYKFLFSKKAVLIF